MIEKHFTLDTNMQGPDHSASLAPKDFEAMVASIRNVEQAMGDGIKRPAPCELPNLDIARKSIVAACDLSAGKEITASDLAIKRPGSGIPPSAWDSLIGRRLCHDISADQQIRWQDMQ